LFKKKELLIALIHQQITHNAEPPFLCSDKISQTSKDRFVRCRRSNTWITASAKPTPHDSRSVFPAVISESNLQQSL